MTDYVWPYNNTNVALLAIIPAYRISFTAFNILPRFISSYHIAL